MKQEPQLELAVLVIIFNRPELTKRVFAQIAKVRPVRLYIAADGPRDKSDVEKCNLSRAISTDINWDCEVKTNFLAENLGCKYAPVRAIDWFFEHEMEGIILEDDCVPHEHFFDFCRWGLRAFRTDKNVWHINGNNFGAPSSLFDREVSFTSLANVWGWASWRDRWEKYEKNPFTLGAEIRLKENVWLVSKLAKTNKLNHLGHLQKGLDAWDYQWQITILNNQGLCLVCRSNLISNIGDGAEATHTKFDSRTNLPTEPTDVTNGYVKPFLNKQLTDWYEKQCGLRSFRNAVAYKSRLITELLVRKAKGLVSKTLYWNTTRIVVASTGRSGSTMLANALVAGLIASRFRLNAERGLGLIVSKFTGPVFIDRLSELHSSRLPVVKTHDFFKQGGTGVRYLFVYGDPLESALSTFLATQSNGRIWFEEHMFHLSSSADLSDLFQKDALNYEKQLLSWREAPTDSVFAVRYDDLWDRVSEISQFVGYDIKLPERKERTLKPNKLQYNKILFNRLQSLYSTCLVHTRR